MNASASPSELGDALFCPRTVALIGASSDPKKNNSRPQRYLMEAGYTGKIVPINPGRQEIFGLPAFPDVASVPFGIDHAFIMVPAAAMEAVIDQCCESKVRVATIFTAGFAETGEEGLALQQRIVEKARRGNLRLLGPNCIGLINIHGHFPLTANAVVQEEKLLPGPVSVVSQSGSMLGSLLTRAAVRNIGFSKMVSIGNESDLAVGEIVSLLVDDPETKVILLFLETIRDGAVLANAARRAFDVGKPVIAFKLGRSAIGRRVATSHTGAMVGADELAAAYFRDNGILRVDTLEGLIELPQLVNGYRPPIGRRAAVMTATGGAAAMIIDRLGVAGDTVPEPSPSLIAGLAGEGIQIADLPLIDLPMGTSEGGRYTKILSALIKSDHCDAVVSVIGSSARSNPAIVRERVLSANRSGKPLAVFLAPQADEGLRLLQEAGIAGFRTPESCADAVHSYLAWKTPVQRPEIAASELAAANQIAGEGGAWNEVRAAHLFAALGVTTAKGQVIADGDQSPDPDCLQRAGRRFAVKCLSSDIPHKTDAGLVALNIEPEDIASEAGRLLERARATFPSARLEGVLVQAMERGLAETILGYRNDPEVGPVVILGMGGVAAEIRPSISVRLAPVDHETALEMIAEIPELRLLSGYRNLPLGDLNALAHAVSAFSRICALEVGRIAEAEINPLIVKEEHNGVVAVDGLVVEQAV